MKILYVGAPSPHLDKFARTFSKLHEVHCAVFRPGGLPNEILLRTRTRLTRWTPALAAPLLSRAIAELRPDVVHAFYLLPFAYLAARAGARPLVISAMGDDIYPPGPASRYASRLLHLSGVPRDWHRGLAGTFDRAIVECAHARARMEELGYDGARIDVVPWGPDADVFRPEARDPALRKRLIGDAGALVVCTRAWWPQYGLADLLRAFARRPFDARLVLLGEGPEGPALRRLSRRLGIEPEVEFVGRVDHRDIPAYVGSADLMVSPARSDTVSVSLLEGMACGLGVVATDVGGTSEFVRDWESGLLVPPGEPGRIADALERLIADPALRRRLGEEARKTILGSADWSAKWREVERVYGRAAGTRSR